MTIAKYYTPSGRLIQRNYRDKSKAEEGGIFPDVEVPVKAVDEIKIFAQYNQVVYVPGQAAKALELKEKDPVLEKAVEILTGKISLENAKEQSQQAAKERKKQKEQDKETAQTQEDDKKAELNEAEETN